MVTIGYFPVYRVGSPTFANLPWSKLSHVVYFNIAPTNTGVIITNVNGDVTVDLPSLVTTAHGRGRKVMIAIGGAGAATDADWEGAINSTNRASFVANLVSFMTTYNLDGVDLDWEPFAISADQTDYLAFIIALRTALGPNKVISIFVTTGDSWKWTFCANAAPYVDFISLSTYDFSYGNALTVHDSPLYHGGSQPTGLSADEAVTNHFNAGVPKNKINIAIPWYAQQWTGKTSLYQAATVNAFTAQLYSALTGATGTTPPTGEVNDATAKGAYIASNPFTSYNSVSNVTDKYNYILAQGLAGVIIWELGQAYFPADAPNDYPLLAPLPLVTSAGARFNNAGKKPGPFKPGNAR